MIGALPFRLVPEPGEPLVEWIWSDGGRFLDPFFDDTVARLCLAEPANHRTRRPRTPLSVLRDAPPGLPLAGLIFHVSRCGSTLLARMLAAVPRNLVASEPPIVDDLLRLRERDPAVSEDDLAALLRGAMRALGTPPAGGAGRLFVKLDCWHLLSLEFFRRAFPGTPFFFVHRHPLEVLVSLIQKPGLTLVRDTVAPAQLGLTPEERDRLTPEEHAAAILGAFYRTACAAHGLLVPVAYESWPEGAVTALAGHGFDEADRASFLAAAAMDAKNPAEPFSPDAQRKRRAASPAQRAASARWAEPDYARWLALLKRTSAAVPKAQVLS